MDLNDLWTGVLCPGGDVSLTSMTADGQQREVRFQDLPAHAGSASGEGRRGGGGEANPLFDTSPAAQTGGERERLLHLLIFHAFFFHAFYHR